MADTPKENEDRYTRFLNAFTTLAPDKTFGGVKLSDFTVQVEKSNAPRRKKTELKNEIKQEDAKIESEDKITLKMCDQIKKGVLADPEHGDDSALYDAFGFVTKSARKSGLTRKKNSTEPVKP